MVQRVTPNHNEWQRMTTGGKWMATSGTESDNEWQQMTESNGKRQWMTANDREWETNESKWNKMILSFN